MAQSFNTDWGKAAFRHQEAAETLNVGRRRDVAGYLYGLAAECAIKKLMLASGMRPSASRNGDDPFYAHFSRLKTILRDDTMHAGTIT